MKVVVALKSKTSGYRELKTQTEYLKMIAANLVNRFGDSIDSIAYSLLMYSVTGSAALMALVVAINFVPTIILQPIAGVLVDRMNKKKVMVLTDIGRGLVVAATALVYAFGEMTTPIILISVILNSSLEALRVPAGSAIVPALLDEDKYEIGAAANQTLSQLCVVIGLALAAPVVEVLGMTVALLIDAGTFIISAFLISLIRAEGATTPAVSGKADIKGVATGLVDGAKYLRSSPVLWTLIVMGMCLNFSFVPLNSIYTPYVTDWIGGAATILSASQLAMVFGSALGSAMYPKFKNLSNKTALLITGGLTAISYVAMAFVPSAGGLLLRGGLAVGIMFLIGVASGMLSVLFGVMFMKTVAPEFMGRISGAMNSLLCIAMPVGSLICAGLSLFLNIPQVYLAYGILTAVMFLLVSRMKLEKE